MINFEKKDKCVDAAFNIWFLDDCTIEDSPEKVIEHVLVVVQKIELAIASLEPNNSKYKLTILRQQTSTEITRTIDFFQEILHDVKTMAD